MNYKLTIDIPEQAFSILKQTPERFARKLLEAALCKWYEQGIISQSKAAEIAGISRYEFLEVLKNHDVSPFQYSAAELEAELD
jgi:predicted HTH domain antitoxin